MRGKPALKRKTVSDSKYHQEKVAKFINYIMRKGKKSLAQRIVYDTFEILKKKGQNPLAIFEKVIENVSPQVEVRSRRIGGANYQIPFPVSGSRRFTLASRWIINAAKERKGRSMSEKLAAEFLDVLRGQGAAIKKKQDVYRMAQANKAFAHFAKYG